MKKLLVLTLVLGMASLASASLSLAIESETLAGVASDDDQAWVAFVAVTDGVAHSTAFTTLGDLDLSYETPYGVQNMGDFGLPALGMASVYEVSVGSATAGNVQPGIQYEITTPDVVLGAVDQGLGRVDLISGDLTEILGTAYVTPEPATLALLGLGALILRRRK